MEHTIYTPRGQVRVGSVIRIDRIEDSSNAFPDGIDRQARELNGKEGTVEHIDGGGQLWGPGEAWR